MRLEKHSAYAFRPTLSRPVMVAPSVVADAIDPSLGHATHPGLLHERLPMGANDNQTLVLINPDVKIYDLMVTVLKGWKFL